MTDAERSWWGWGHAHRALDDDAARQIADRLPLTRPEGSIRPMPTGTPALRRPRIDPPGSLERLVSSAPMDRAGHTFGKAYRDVIRALDGDLQHPPDLVVFPECEQHVEAVLHWCAQEGIAAIPYGGGSSVVGGVEAVGLDDYRGVVSIDLTRLGRVTDVDVASRAARIEAGALGPSLEDALRPHGLTLRHFPQSFEFSTLGGWIATRAGGHYATARTHIDDFVESIRAVTPAGVVESRRVPASGAGPSPDRLLLGSEGAFGVITAAWMRLQVRPAFRAGGAVRFPGWDEAVTATRLLAQTDLEPANCRLLDGLEAIAAGLGDGRPVLILGLESAHRPVATDLELAFDLCRGAGGLPEERNGADAPSTWRRAFLDAPYQRDALARLGYIVETFETACTWDRFASLHSAIIEAASTAVASVCGAPGVVTTRLTHVYSDGAAPYFTVFASGRRGAEVVQWDEIKAAVSEAILAGGGTITHHHAVGRVHRPWYDRQRPAPFAAALSAAKAALDPAWILNPGVLIDVPE